MEHELTANYQYEVGTLKPFPQRMTVFSRVQWDKTCIGYGEEGANQKQNMTKGKPGYSRVDFALHSASRTIQSKVGYSKEPKGAKDTDRYEPQDVSEFTEQVKSAARLYGAALVGICQLNPLWLYANDQGELVSRGGASVPALDPKESITRLL